MDGGEYLMSAENMDPTLSELGQEFTLGDIDGKRFRQSARQFTAAVLSCQVYDVDIDWLTTLGLLTLAS